MKKNSIMYKLCVLFLVVLSTTVDKLSHSIKPILTKIYESKIWIRLVSIIEVIRFIVSLIVEIVMMFVRIILFFVLNTIDLFLMIPLFIFWLLTGKNYIFKLEYVVNEKTGFFEDMFEDI